ncbi:5-oxoprolinase subunit PxpA [Pontibacter cellulosilyticus]|uniref:5-oxoprolinase subunit A n=1 Tax=Pontibacter cellulosilyticus TaxID=1720253 RepID=A0A923N539_9BACT|nr:5-oxoprolinase subunit PxpA [Pontibacter cellulosilyticus]MBC5992024.1 5-oxoprolinase subunit PxpA [Pontibacter cellulosilyticus]
MKPLSVEPLAVDLNCDMGESFGAYKIGNDEAILPFITSANIACGYHAGDPMVMQRTVQLALQHKVAVGAHPGLPDLVGFGRREMAVSAAEVYAMVVYQIGALQAIAKAEGAALHHVKPHGALYNMAAVNPQLAQAIAEAVYKVCPEAVLYGLAGSTLIDAGKAVGIRTANEVFADRTYQQDGTLTSRRQPDALITDPNKAVQQVVRMVKENKVKSQQQKDVSIQADTVCIHGDGSHALEFAKFINETLTKENIQLKAV